jgi:ketosteroid isomerase-like protein
MKSFVLLFVLSLLITPALADTATRARVHAEAFARAMNAQDIDSALALYAEDARVVWPGIGDEAHGRSQFVL